MSAVSLPIVNETSLPRNTRRGCFTLKLAPELMDKDKLTFSLSIFLERKKEQKKSGRY